MRITITLSTGILVFQQFPVHGKWILSLGRYSAGKKKGDPRFTSQAVGIIKTDYF